MHGVICAGLTADPSSTCSWLGQTISGSRFSQLECTVGEWQRAVVQPSTPAEPAASCCSWTGHAQCPDHDGCLIQIQSVQTHAVHDICSATWTSTVYIRSSILHPHPSIHNLNLCTTPAHFTKYLTANLQPSARCQAHQA